jgi:tetrahydromethanopterin S-methyltransferase subunit H
MFKFNTKQNVYEIGKIKIGGQPGELPTVLIGSIFWLGQKMVQDANKGIFDAKQAENIVNNMEILSDLTGVPFAFDIVGTTEEAFSKYIPFLAEHSEAPLMLDAMSPKTRMAGAEIVKNAGLQDRCIYNSFYKGVSKVEAEKVKECGITASIVLADNPKDNSLEGKMQVLEEALALAKEGGITKPLIDTAIPAFEPAMGTAVGLCLPRSSNSRHLHCICDGRSRHQAVARAASDLQDFPLNIHPFIFCKFCLKWLEGLER